MTGIGEGVKDIEILKNIRLDKEQIQKDHMKRIEKRLLQE
jgi:hypothetical protein